MVQTRLLQRREAAGEHELIALGLEVGHALPHWTEGWRTHSQEEACKLNIQNAEYFVGAPIKTSLPDRLEMAVF